MFKYLVDFCCITESWCPDKIPDEKIDIETYTPVRRNRHGKIGGGIIAYIHNSIPYERLNELHHTELETFWIRLNPRRMPQQYNPLGCVFHPPKTDDYTMVDHIVSSLDYIKLKYPSAGIILRGDFKHLPDHRIRLSHKLK